MLIIELFESKEKCPKCHSMDIKTYSDGEKECNHCHATWDVKDTGKSKETVKEASSFPGPGYSYPFNPEDPRNIYKKQAYDNKMAAKAALDAESNARKSFQAQLNKKPAAAKLDLDTVWREVENVVGRIYPDGDPIDWLIPWFRKQGIEDHRIGDIIEKAARKNGYKDLYDYWDSIGKLYGESVNESAEHPNTDEILYHLTDGMRALTNSNSWLDVDDERMIKRIYDYWRTYLKQGDYESFMQAYDEMLGRYPDAAGELINAMFESAGLSNQATIEEFLAKVSESRVTESRLKEAPLYTGKKLPTHPAQATPMTGAKKVDAKLEPVKTSTSPLTKRNTRLVKEDWGSSDWYPVMQDMHRTINNYYDGAITPESVEAAARDAASFYYDAMGYDTAEDAVDRIISVFLARSARSGNQRVRESKLKENFPFKDALSVGYPDVEIGDTIRTRKMSMMGVVTKLGQNRAGYDEVYFKVEDGRTWKTPLSNVTIVKKGSK